MLTDTARYLMLTRSLMAMPSRKTRTRSASHQLANKEAASGLREAVKSISREVLAAATRQRRRPHSPATLPAPAASWVRWPRPAAYAPAATRATRPHCCAHAATPLPRTTAQTPASCTRTPPSHQGPPRRAKLRRMHLHGTLAPRRSGPPRGPRAAARKRAPGPARAADASRRPTLLRSPAGACMRLRSAALCSQGARQSASGGRGVGGLGACTFVIMHAAGLRAIETM